MEAEKRKISLAKVTAFNSFPGRGVEGKVDGANYVLGNEALMREKKIKLDDLKNQIAAEVNEGKSFIWVASEKELWE